MTNRRMVVGMMMLFLLIASGCGRSPGVTFYTLDAVAPEAAAPAITTHAINVGPGIAG